jgi:hypothetical protein
LTYRPFSEAANKVKRMQPENFRFGGGSTATVLHPIVLVAMLIVIVLTFLLSRKNLVVPLLLSTFLIPLGQQFVVAGVHLFALRIIVLAGLVRMLFSKRSPEGDLLAGGLNSVDKAFLLWAFLHALAFTLLFREMGAVVNQVGYLWDGLGGYFILRFMIQDEEDVKRAINCFAFLAVVFAICMIREQWTRQNIFGLLGGVTAASEIREGRIRSQAVFQHSLLAGTFGATALPLFLLLWKSGKSKLLAITGAAGATVMVATASSSTPVIAWLAGIAAVFCWPFRKRMRTLRWGFVALFLSLCFVMQAPIWFLIARVSVAGGSSSYHRAMLVDQFVRHVPDWWLLGTNQNETWGNDMWDTSNRYVEEGETGGLAAFLCFLAVIYWSFARIGTARKSAENDRQKEWLLWILGSTLFAHTVAFWGISYFDQTRVTWFALLAMISAVTAPLLNPMPLLQEKLTVANLDVSKPVYRAPSFPNARTKVLHHKFQR